MISLGNRKRFVFICASYHDFHTSGVYATEPRIVLAGIELVHMLKKGQLKTPKKGASMSFANQFYSLAA